MPAVRRGLKDPNRQVRALCVRALGFLQAHEAVEDLGRVLLGDRWETARLLAADSLGQIHTEKALDLLRGARKSEKKGDVLLHIGIALKRKTALDPRSRQELLKIVDSKLRAASVGKEAPDFELCDSKGSVMGLSSFRGRFLVVLVFIYGDG